MKYKDFLLIFNNQFEIVKKEKDYLVLSDGKKIIEIYFYENEIGFLFKNSIEYSEFYFTDDNEKYKFHYKNMTRKINDLNRILDFLNVNLEDICELLEIEFIDFKKFDTTYLITDEHDFSLVEEKEKVYLFNQYFEKENENIFINENYILEIKEDSFVLRGIKNKFTLSYFPIVSRNFEHENHFIFETENYRNEFKFKENKILKKILKYNMHNFLETLFIEM